MCFSATASFTAAAVITVAGIFSLTKARTIPTFLLALSPLFFALQQALEGIVWLTLTSGDASSILNRIGVDGFLFFAGVLWPVWLPGCLYLLEDDKKRKKILLCIFILGLVAASKIFFRLVDHTHTAVTMDHHISYPMFALTYSVTSLKPVFFSYSLDVFLSAAYLVAVIMPFFISTLEGMWIIGVITAIGFFVAQIFFELAFGSVWCFFGALSTLMIYKILVNYNKRHLN